MSSRVRSFVTILLILYSAPLAAMLLGVVVSGFFRSQPEMVRGAAALATVYDRDFRIILADMLLPLAATFAMKNEGRNRCASRMHLAIWFSGVGMGAFILYALGAGLEDRLLSYGKEVCEAYKTVPLAYAHETLMYLAVVGGFSAGGHRRAAEVSAKGTTAPNTGGPSA